MFGLLLSISMLVTQPLGPSEGLDYREPASLKIELETDFYPWASLGYGRSYILGQKVSTVYNIGVGAGYRFPVTDRITLKAEIGVAYPIMSSKLVIQQEIAYTYLVARHESEWRPIPVKPERPYDQDSYGTTWKLNYGALIRLGADFKINDRWSVAISYRYFNPDGLLEIYAPEAKPNGGWWQEFVRVNMNAVEAGITWHF